MQDLIRKHRQLFAILIFVVIGFPMLFFGSQYSSITPTQTGANDAAIGKVGEVPLKLEDVRRMVAPYTRPQQDGSEKTLADLQVDGTLAKVIDRMTDGAIITNLEKQREFTVNKEVLEQQLKDLPDFKNPETQEFDKKIWNEWVASPQVNWNEIYERIQEDVSRQVFLDMVLAPANRVSDAEIAKELEKKYQTLKVKYYKVDVPVEPTEEQIKAQYDKELARTDGKPKYQKPDQFLVDYVAFSLQATVPPVAQEIIKQAREGGDFAALADQHSALSVKNGGEMGGWQRETPTTPESRKALFALKPGEVSEPVAGGNGFYIYKVDEERTAEDGVREVKGRQILLNAKMTEEDRAKVAAKAKELSDKAKAAGSLAKAVEEMNAAGAGLEIKRTPAFDKSAVALEGIAPADLMRFKMAFDTLTDATKYDPIDPGENGQHIYVAEVAEKTPGVVPPLEEIKEDVKKDAIRELKSQDDYKNKVKEAADKIKAAATSIDEIPAKFPELTGTVVESDPFKVKEFIVKVPSTVAPGERPFIPAEQVAEALEGKEPGQLAGPIAGFGGNDSYFVSLVEKTAATEEDKKEWEKERKDIRQQKVQQAKGELMQDLSKDLRERTRERFLVEVDSATLNEMVEASKPEPLAETPAAPAEAPATTATETPAAPAADAPSTGATETPAAESKPAETPAPAPAQ